MSTILVLCGPKGAGKTTLGECLERVFGAAFVRAEPIWIAHGELPRSERWEAEGFEKVVEATREASRTHALTVVETTGAAPFTSAFVAALRAQASVLLVRVLAPLPVCLARVLARSTVDHIPIALERVAEINEIAERVNLPFDAVLDNGGATDEVGRRRGLAALLLELGLPVRATIAELRTERLLLRTWRPTDRGPFSAMNADPSVMEHFPRPFTTSESDAMVDRIEARMAEQGFGLWVLEAPGVLDFAGFVGLSIPTFDAPFMPVVEIGWRLRPEAWGHGWATEAARAVLAFGHDELGLREIVSMTSTTNLRSMRVMERIGMVRDPARDFLHPRVPVGHRLQAHVLYVSRC